MTTNKIKRVAVIGAGTMGHSIAQVYAENDFSVSLLDRNQDALDRAKKLIHSNLLTLADFNRVSENSIPQILERIDFSLDMDKALKNVDLVVEAVYEDPEVKKNVYDKMNKICNNDVIFACNTSSLNIYEIVEIDNPGRLIIHHWFAPPHIIPLVEIVPGPETKKEIVRISSDLLKSLGKKPVIMEEFVPSFIVNRIQNVINVQVYEMLAKGWATPKQIDLAIKSSLGIRLPIVGLAQSQDFTGLDLVLDVQKPYRMNKRYPQVQELVEKGHLGVKSGKGFYDYGDRTEEEILKERDEKYLKLLAYLEKIDAFRPI